MSATLDRNPFQLALRAECASPDTLASPGARFLSSVLDAVNETLESGEDFEVSDEAARIADDSPDVYTGPMWAEFVDLAAYNEDPTDLGVDGSDMDQSARICLYIIAERLAVALFEEAAELDEDEAAV